MSEANFCNIIKDDLTLVGPSGDDFEYTVPKEAGVLVKHFLKTLMKNLNEIEGFKDRDFVVDYLRDTSIKFGDIVSMTKRYAKFLAGAGVKKGDVVHLLTCGGDLNLIIVVIAAWTLGAVPAYGESTLSDEALVDQIQKCKSKVLVSGADNFYRTACLAKTVKAFHFGLYDFACATLDEDYKLELPEADLDNDLAVILFSSGTTGFPKAIPYTHRMAWEFCKTTKASEDYPDTYQVSGVPVEKGFVSVEAVFNSLLRMTTVLNLGQGDTKLSNFINAVNRFRPSSVALVAFDWVLMWKKGILTQIIQPHGIKRLWPIAMSIPGDCEDYLRAVLPGVEIYNVYGANETGLLTVSRTCRNLGVLAPKVEMKVKDILTGKRLGPNELGLICFKSPTAMKEYMGDWKKSSEYYDNEGFAEVGDVGYFDEAGNIFIEGRVNDLIRSDFKPIKCSELEAALLKHPDITDCGVFAKKLVDGREVPAAWVALKEGQGIQVTAEDIFEFSKSQLLEREWIRGGIKLVKKIPRNPTGKIMRHVMINTDKA